MRQRRLADRRLVWPSIYVADKVRSCCAAGTGNERAQRRCSPAAPSPASDGFLVWGGYIVRIDKSISVPGRIFILLQA